MEMVHVSCEKNTRAKIHELVFHSTLGISGQQQKFTIYTNLELFYFVVVFFVLTDIPDFTSSLAPKP